MLIQTLSSGPIRAAPVNQQYGSASPDRSSRVRVNVDQDNPAIDVARSISPGDARARLSGLSGKKGSLPRSIGCLLRHRPRDEFIRSLSRERDFRASDSFEQFALGKGNYRGEPSAYGYS